MKFYPLDGLMIEELWRQSDDKLLKSITTNDKHVLYKFLPEVKNTGHNLRKRVHPYNLPDKDDRNFFNRFIIPWHCLNNLHSLYLILCVCNHFCGLSEWRMIGHKK